MAIELTAEQMRRLSELVKNPPRVKMFTFRTIEQLTGASQRNLRYAMDHVLVDESIFRAGERLAQGRGVAQEFSTFTGFIVALAALLLESGLRGGLVRNAMEFTFRWASPSSPSSHVTGIPAFLISRWASHLVVEIGDGANIRIRVHGKPKPDELPCPQGTGWVPLEGDEPVRQDYRPVVTISLDMSELVTKLR